MLNKTRRGAALRESAKSAAAASVELLRLVLLEVGQRMAARHQLCEANEVFHLAGTEVQAYLNGDWSGTGAAELVGDRKRALERWQLETPCDVLVETQSPAVGSDAIKQAILRNTTASRRWKGVAAAPGWAEGVACVIDQPHLGDRLATGDVLVAPSTDPGWTPLFLAQRGGDGNGRLFVTRCDRSSRIWHSLSRQHSGNYDRTFPGRPTLRRWRLG